ncbi:urease accessory protein [Rhizobium leguminosarum bv. trifolii]|nr:urease accessory protein [Rhizobium leguminosarum bv. trifolii]
MKTIAGLMIIAGLPSFALAHNVAGEASGLASGFAHPMSGLDHVLAMLLVGVFAYQIGGRALWLIPMTFLVMMAIGGALGLEGGMAQPSVELAIALSVVAFGIIALLGLKAPVPVVMGTTAFFAFHHGYAHSAEMPEQSSGLEYAAGFILATALLHSTGILVSLAVDRLSEQGTRFLARCAGTAGVIVGAGLTVGLI